jgi:hypothetical protein
MRDTAWRPGCRLFGLRLVAQAYCSALDAEPRSVSVCSLPRTVCKGVGERRRDGAERFADLGYPLTIMLAYMLARAVDGPDFDRSRSGSGRVPAAAHGVRFGGKCGQPFRGKSNLEGASGLE